MIHQPGSTGLNFDKLPNRISHNTEIIHPFKVISRSSCPTSLDRAHYVSFLVPTFGPILRLALHCIEQNILGKYSPLCVWKVDSAKNYPKVEALLNLWVSTNHPPASRPKGNSLAYCMVHIKRFFCRHFFGGNTVQCLACILGYIPPSLPSTDRTHIE